MDQLDALERRGDALEAFAACQTQANKYMKEKGTDELVKYLRQARLDRRPVKMGTINTLVLLAHIDRLEAELSKERLVLP